MERIITYQIEKNHEGNTILQFLKKRLYTSQAIIALKKTPEGILLNGVWAYVNQKISSGDILTIKLSETESSEKIVPEHTEIDIVYEDEDILVVNKPADMPVHPSQNHYTGTLANAIAGYFAVQEKPFIFRCVNRLDRDTTGLTILCKHQLAGGILSNMVSERLIKRTYLAICSDDGSLPENGTIDAPIARKDGSTIERCVDFENGERAVTHYRKISFHPDKQVSLIQLRLETGRTHQIRVHMTHIGHPLIGDDLYGSDCTLIKRQALHSYSLKFTHPVTLEEMYFAQELPEDMADIISRVPGSQSSSEPCEVSCLHNTAPSQHWS